MYWHQQQIEKSTLERFGIEHQVSASLDPTRDGIDFHLLSRAEQVSCLNTLSTNYRFLSASSQSFFISYLSLHTESSDRKDFVRLNRAYLSDDIADSLLNLQTGPYETLSTLMDYSTSAAAIASLGEVGYKHTTARVKYHASITEDLSFLQDASILGLVSGEEIQRRSFDIMKKAGLLIDVQRHEGCTSGLIRGPQAAAFYFRGKLDPSFGPAHYGDAARSELDSSYYAKQAFGLLLMLPDEGHPLLYSVLDKKLWALSSVGSPAVYGRLEDVPQNGRHVAAVRALLDRGYFDLHLGHPEFDSSMLLQEVIIENLPNLCAHLGNSPVFSKINGSADGLSTKGLVKDLEGALRFAFYDCLNSPCADYAPCFSYLRGHYESIKDPVLADAFASTVTRVVLDFASPLAKSQYLLKPFLTPSSVACMDEFILETADLEACQLVGEFLLSSGSLDPSSLSAVEASGVVAARQVDAKMIGTSYLRCVALSGIGDHELKARLHGLPHLNGVIGTAGPSTKKFLSEVGFGR